MEFSRALLEISEGISDKMQSKNEMLIEVFCENLFDIHIKGDIKRLVRSQTTISFSALRSEAILLEEDGMGNSYQNACVRGIQEPHHIPSDSTGPNRSTIRTTCNNSVGNCYFVTITTTGVSGWGDP